MLRAGESLLTMHGRTGAWSPRETQAVQGLFIIFPSPVNTTQGQCPCFSQMEDHGRARGTKWSLEKPSTYTAFSRTVGTSNPEK